MAFPRGVEALAEGQVGSHGGEEAEVRRGVPEGAVRIVAETGRTLAEVARDRGINETALATWVSRAPASRRHRVRR